MVHSDAPKGVKGQDHIPKRVDHFTRYADKNGKPRGKCKYCGKTYAVDHVKTGNSRMRNHMKVCKKYIDKANVEEDNQTIQSFTGSSSEINQEGIEHALARMIIMNGMPLTIVQAEGFREFVSELCPEFVIPSLKAIATICYRMYLDEKEKLRNYFKLTGPRVSLTTDTWTCIRGLTYLCLTAHYIDDDWKLHKVMLNFIPCSTDEAEEVGLQIEKCLLEWGIDKVFSITLDNASCHDATVAYLRSRFVESGTAILGGRFLHMRCVSQILNLVVIERFKELNESVKRVRAAVMCVRVSPDLLKKFYDHVFEMKLGSKKSLYLDTPTKWNSVYMMLKKTLIFKKVYQRFAEEEADFFAEFMSGGSYENIGLTTERDWVLVERIVKVLDYFHELTLRVSGSSLMATSAFFDEITDVVCLMNEWVKSDDNDLVDIARKMKFKFDKVWGKLENMNMMLYVAAILDPRFKFMYVQFVLKNSYGPEQGEQIANLARSALNDVFEEYKNLYSSTPPTCESVKDNDDDPENKATHMRAQKMKFQQMIYEASLCEPELDKYLNESLEKSSPDFDVISWWKTNGPRFPVLSRLARDVLAMPISSVALDSAFSIGGGVGSILDESRALLPPNIAQGLICCQNWISPTPVNPCLEEDDESEYYQTIEEGTAFNVHL